MTRCAPYALIPVLSVLCALPAWGGEGLVELSAGIERTGVGTGASGELRVTLSETVQGWDMSFETMRPLGASDAVPTFRFAAERDLGDWRAMIEVGDIGFGQDDHLLPAAPRRALRFALDAADGGSGFGVFVARPGFGPPGLDEVSGSGILRGVEAYAAIGDRVAMSVTGINGQGRLDPNGPHLSVDGLAFAATYASEDGAQDVSASLALSRTSTGELGRAATVAGRHQLSGTLAFEWRWERVDPGFLSFGNPGQTTDFDRREAGLAWAEADWSADMRINVEDTNLDRAPDRPGFSYTTLQASVRRDTGDVTVGADLALARSRLTFALDPDDYPGADMDEASLEMFVGRTRDDLSWTATLGRSRLVAHGPGGFTEDTAYARLDLAGTRGNTTWTLGTAVEVLDAGVGDRTTIAALTAGLERTTPSDWTLGANLSLAAARPGNTSGTLGVWAARPLTNSLDIELRAETDMGGGGDTSLGVFLTYSNPFTF